MQKGKPLKTACADAVFVRAPAQLSVRLAQRFADGQATHGIRVYVHVLPVERVDVRITVGKITAVHEAPPNAATQRL